MLDLEFIARWEGFCATPYICPAGCPTIGYGHVIKKHEDFPKEGISRAQAMALLEVDAASALQAVRRLIKININTQQVTALTSFTYNLGTGALQRSTLRQVINRQEWEAVPREWRKWVWAGGRKLPGLVRRRAAEIALFEA